MQANSEIYILLTDTGTLFSKMIKMFTKAPYNHVSIAFDHELKQLYSFGRKKPYNPFIAGFVKEDIRNVLFCNAKCALYRYGVDPQKHEDLHAYVKNLYDQRDQYKYNLLGLIGVLLQKDFNRQRAFFCSQFVASVLEANDLKLIAKPAAFTTPADFQQVLAPNLLFKGTISELLMNLDVEVGMPTGTLPA